MNVPPQHGSHDGRFRLHEKMAADGTPLTDWNGSNGRIAVATFFVNGCPLSPVRRPRAASPLPTITSRLARSSIDVCDGWKAAAIRAMVVWSLSRQDGE